MTANREEPPFKPHIYDVFDNYMSQYAGRSIPETGGPNVRVPITGIVMDSFVSCGVSLLSGLSYVTPQRIVDKVLKERNQDDTKKIKEAFVVFSDIANSFGDRLYKYIRDNNLGEIMAFGPRMNPNTGHMIMLYVWQPPHESLSPKDRLLPIHGYTMKYDSLGRFECYERDIRFVDSTTAKTARGA